MKQSRLLALIYLAAQAALLESSAAHARDAAATESNTSVSADTTATDRLADEFTVLAGSRENAQNLVTGLRNATLIRLTAMAPAVPASTFTPLARPMAYPDIRKALSLAQAQLLSKHIDRPTPEQIKASLAGGELPNAQGEITRIIGILSLHQRGMSWDQIARVIRVAAPKNWVAT